MLFYKKLVLFITLIFIISGGLYYFYHDEEEMKERVCSLPNSKFDCYPRGVPNEKSCLARGCCWFPDNDRLKCIYPKDYGSYKVINKTSFVGGRLVKLELKKNSIYPNNIRSLAMNITPRTMSMLNIKITDDDSDRYIPPYPMTKQYGYYNDSTDYSVVIDEEYFGFAVIRNSTGTVLFDTRNVGGFTYCDQFLQLSALLPTKYIYGLGQHRNDFLLDTNWKHITLFNYDSPANDDTNSYSSHPFYLAIEKYGICHGVLLLNSNAMDIILQPDPAITYRPIGGIFDFYFFTGPSPADVIAQYTELVGRPFLPPYWALGFHISRSGLKSLDNTIDLWNRTRSAGIPFDSLWNDIDYMDNKKNFEISESYRGLSDFVETLHTHGMHYVLAIEPGISSREKQGSYFPFEDGKKSKIFVKNSSDHPLETQVWKEIEGTVFPDFTNPETFQYWNRMLERLYQLVKFDGVWLNMNEVTSLVDGSLTGCDFKGDRNYESPPYVPNVKGDCLNHKTICMSSRHYFGLQYNLHNIFGFAESVLTGISVGSITQKRPIVLSRATFPGNGVYAGHWTGDIHSTWDDMKHSVSDILSFNLFGIPMVGANICGFKGDSTKELCQRWTQLGAFYPLSRNHNSERAVDQDPAIWGSDFVESIKKALLMRYHLLPYLYSLFAKAYFDGSTVVRPLFFEFPKDENTYKINTEFMWGEALLVVPVLDEGRSNVTGYFPSAIWFDAYTLERYQSSGDYVTITAPLDTIPLFFRGGNIIPYQEPGLTTKESLSNPFGLYVTVDQFQSARGFLVWDDGEGNGTLATRNYNLLQFIMNSNILSGLPTNWGYNVSMKLNTVKVMGLFDDITNVTVDNEIHADYKFDREKGVLIIESVNVDLSKSFFVKWFAEH